MSIQDRLAPDRVAGHLATGILVDGDVVLIPAPPEALFDRERQFQVLIFPTELTEHSKIDALDCWKFGSFALEDRERRPVAMTGRLTHHSTYAAQIGEVDSRRLASTLEDRDGDLWAALWELDAVPRGINEISPELLAQADRIEREQHLPKRTHHTFDDYGDMTGGWCIFFCFCLPHKHD
ncbi:hypothetical protein Rhe02_00580 [Rhizocola hellebori]|uniref:Uncharacterized protein n=1 Tax=Rhizocola hellebori TaxID=1392758 RepID=A0A8J3VCW6_9ACTN|nr:hypothetical protein [Rhizocola hellebori]GIH01991.1 hypothetical protein Rhe02_00580 [Rhizocola hellebori]